LPAISNLAVVISFKINQDYISKTLCEKKEEKVNTCNGHCHLKKELKKVSETENESNLPISYKEKMELVFIQPEFTFSFYNFQSPKSSFSFYTESDIPTISNRIFHPPLT
jgi:hypothetical protein